MKLSELFYIFCGKRITEEEAYIHKGDLPCITAQTYNDGIAWSVDKNWILNEMGGIIVNQPCVTWAKDGYAGRLFYRDHEFCPNDHCGVLIPREKYINQINLEWFAFACEEYVMSFNTSSHGQGMIYNETMKNIDIEFPSKDIQDNLVCLYKKQIDTMKQLNEILSDINNILTSVVSFNNIKTERMPLEQITLLNKGSNLISEEIIYKNYQKYGTPVYSSATNNGGIMGYVSNDFYNKFNKKGHKDELTWSTNGNAGMVFYHDKDYLYSEKCGRLILKDNYIKKVNLRYLQLYLNQNTYKYVTSSANNGKLDIVNMKNIPIILPPKEIQDNIAEKYIQLSLLKNKLQSILIEQMSI